MSGSRDLQVGAERDEDGDWVITSPAVGWWTAIPSAGSWIGPMHGPGVLRRLKTDYRLVLPGGVQGRVASVDDESRRVVAVEHGELLLRLTHDERKVPAGAASSGSKAPAGGTAEGEFAVRAPTAGVFYRRSAPGASSFVEVGQTVRRGQPVGLVEVMKTFHQILMEGRDAPARGEVTGIRCEDGEVVTAGQVLVIVRGDGRGSAKP